MIDVGIDPTTGKRKQLTRTFGTLKEAKAECARITNRRQEGTLVPPNKVTVNEWLDQWLAMKAEDLEETTIYNYRITLDRVRGRQSLAGERALPLPAPVLAALESFKALQAKEKLALGEAYADSGYVLVHETGEAFTIKQLRRRAYRLMEIFGLRRVRLCDARSSCLTYLASNGVPDHILARWAGHTNVRTTKKWYVKPDVEDLRAAATAWNGLHGVESEGQA
ncbi:tyrosine-type recombinase/integrase [Streptomyces sp. V4I8]|uniref:tyrosine-type recombinase/integrase n=1 Tax=Streptomyces sp. V4I8 TaxID=3156469 RepID=UPI00351347E2